ncbi:MAG: hypothetical protein QOE66_2355 [Chloroflexota bacterium]|jgi:hypothetical protein|nr:hypothetical protein [Chloroflexota bacterium]
MADLDAEARDRLRDSSFAYIDSEGERHLPIHDAAHVRNAVARFDQTDFQSKSARYAAARLILAAAKRHDIEVDHDSEVAKASRS